MGCRGIPRSGPPLLPPFLPAVEPQNRGNAEGDHAQQADETAGNHEGGRQPHALGEESRAQQPDDRRQESEAAVERQHPPQESRFDPCLEYRDERGVEDAARNTRGGREGGEETEGRRRQQPRQQEGGPDGQIHQVDQHDAVDAVVAGAHDGAAGQRSDAPDDLDEAHLAGPAAEVVERHQREEHPHGHDEEPHGDGQSEEASQSRLVVHGREPFVEFLQQVRAAVRAFGVRDADEGQRGAGDDGPEDVQQQDVADRREGQQQGSQRRACDVGERRDHLIDAGDARKLRLRGQQRHRGLHGRNVEGRTHGAAGQQQVDVPQFGGAEPEEHGEPQRAEGDETVGKDHRALAVPAVDIDPDEEPQHGLRKHPGDGRQGQHLGRTGLDAHPEDDRIGDDRTAEDRDQLSAPNDGEGPFPVLHDGRVRGGSGSEFLGSL